MQLEGKEEEKDGLILEDEEKKEPEEKAPEVEEQKPPVCFISPIFLMLSFWIKYEVSRISIFFSI